MRRARAARPDLPLAVEVRDDAEIDEALAAGAPRLLLDNMTPEQVRAAVARVAGRAELEVSGGVTPETILVYATIDGVDYVSMGALTHSAPSLDLSLSLETALPMTLLSLDNIPALQDEVRALAAERGAVILAHNYQVPEVQEVADYVGDSLGLSQQAAASDADVIAFCGVHFMAETASILCPEKTVLLPDPDAGCSLADSITAPQLRAWKAKHPGAVVVMYVNTSAEVKAETDYCVTSSNAVAVVEHIYREHGEDTEILFGPDMFLGAFVEKRTGRPMRVWDGECHVHAGIRPSDISEMRAEHPGADFLIHPECGCSTSVMEYVAAGDVDPDGVHMLSTGGMLAYAQGARPGGTAIVATETGMLHGLRQAAPDVDFIAANEAASCRYMKMITLPKLRDALRDGQAGGQGAAGDRGAGAHRDRAHGRDRLADELDGDEHRAAGRAVDGRLADQHARAQRAQRAVAGAAELLVELAVELLVAELVLATALRGRPARRRRPPALPCRRTPRPRRRPGRGSSPLDSSSAVRGPRRRRRGRRRRCRPSAAVSRPPTASASVTEDEVSG